MPNNGPWQFDSSQGNLIVKIDYDVNSNAIYQGWAAPGTATSDTGWRIVKNTYDGSNRFTGSTFPSAAPSFGFIWDNRTTYSYS